MSLTNLDWFGKTSSNNLQAKVVHLPKRASESYLSAENALTILLFFFWICQCILVRRSYSIEGHENSICNCIDMGRHYVCKQTSVKKWLLHSNIQKYNKTGQDMKCSTCYKLWNSEYWNWHSYIEVVDWRIVIDAIMCVGFSEAWQWKAVAFQITVCLWSGVYVYINV